MPDYRNIHTQLSDVFGNDFFVKVDDTSNLNLFTVDNVSNALTVSSAWQKIFESPKSGEPSGERGTNFYSAGRKLDFPVITNESNETALIDMFFIGHTNRVPLYYPQQNNTYPNGSTVMVKSAPVSKDIFGNSFSNVSQQHGEIRSAAQRYVLFQLETPNGEEVIPGLPAGAIPGLKSDSNWAYLSDTVSDAGICAFPLTNEVDPTTNAGERKLSLPPFSVEVTILLNNTIIDNWQIDNCPGFDLDSPTINYEAWYFQHPDDFDSENFDDEDNPSRTAQIDSLINIRDASPLDIVWNYYIGRLRDWSYSWKGGGDESAIQDAHNAMAAFAAAGETLSTSTFQIKITVANANKSFFVHPGLTSELEQGSSHEEWIHRSFFKKLDSNNQYKTINGTDTQWKGVWEDDKTYLEDDVVAVLGDSSPIDGKISVPFYYYVRARKDILIPAPKPFSADHPDPNLMISGRSTSMIHDLLVPLDTEYWKCLSRNYYASPGTLSSWLGLPGMSKTFQGTDIKILSYSAHLVPNFYDSQALPGGTYKTYLQYTNNQRYFLSDSVVRDFRSKTATQADVNLGLASNIGQIFHKYPKSVIFDSSQNIEDRLLFKIEARDYQYHGSDGPGNLTGGGWPGKSGDPDSSYITADLFNNDYTEGGESISYPVSFAINRIKAKGGNFHEWIPSSNETDSHKKITFSQSTEFDVSSRLPSIQIGILGDYDGTDVSSFFWNSDVIPIRHRGVNIPFYINPQVINVQGEYSDPSSTNNLHGWVSAIASNSETSLRGNIFPDNDGVLFSATGGTNTASITNHSGISIRHINASEEYVTIVETAQDFHGDPDVGFTSYLSGTNNEILSNSLDLGSICANANIAKIGNFKKIGYIQFPCNTGDSFSIKYIGALASFDSDDYKDKTKINNFVGSSQPAMVIDGEGLVSLKNVSLVNQLAGLTGSDPDEYVNEVVGDEKKLEIDLATESVAAKIGSAEGSVLEGFVQVDTGGGATSLFGALFGGGGSSTVEYTASYPLQYNKGKFLSNTTFDISPVILMDQPSLMDHQNVKFHDHTSSSYIRTKAQRTSSSNKFYIYPDAPDNHKFGWRINLPLNDYKSGGSRYIGPYQTNPTLTFYKNGAQTYTKIIPDGAAVIAADLLDVNKTNFNGLAENDVVGIEFYDGIPDEEDAGRKKIEATVDILTYPTAGSIQNKAPSDTLYYYGGDNTTYSITPYFPHHSNFGSIVRLSKNETTDYFEHQYNINDSISAITYNPNNLDGKGALDGAQLVVSMDDGAIFGPGQSRGNGVGSLPRPVNMPYIYRGDYTWTNSDPQVNQVMVNYAYDVVELTSPTFSSYPENYKGNKFWVYDGTGASSGITYGAGQVAASSWSTVDATHFKGLSTLTASGTGVTDGSVGLNTTDGTFSMNRAQFADHGENSTIEFFDGFFPTLSNPLSKVSFTKEVKQIAPPSISNLTLAYIGQYKLWPSSSITIGSGDLTLSADVTSESAYASLKIKNLSGNPDIQLHTGIISETIEYSLNKDFVGDSTNLEVQDNIKANGDLAVSASISAPDIVVVEPELPKPISMEIKYESETGTTFWRKMGSFPHMFNKIHQDSTNNLEGDYFDADPSINRRGFLTSHIGSNMRDTFYSPMRNMIVPVNKNDTTTETDFMLDNTTLGAEANYSYYNMGGSSPSTALVKANVHGSRILFDPDRRGINEPNIWTSQSSVDADQWGVTSTYRGGGKCIDISPNAAANLMFDESTKFLGGTHQNTPATSNHGDGVDDLDINNHDYKIWSPVNYQGLDSWEEIGRYPSSGNYTAQSSHWWSNVWNKKVSNVTFLGAKRLIGWRVSAPHISSRDGENSTFQDNYNAEVVLIKNGSPAWGYPQPQKCWSTMGDGNTIIDIIGTQTKGCVGLQNARRITKIVNGVFPGVTYRLYLSLAYRKSGSDASQNIYGPSGARVYVIEPHQAEDETTDITNELIAYGEFTCNACRSIDYNQSNMVGADGKQTNFARSDPYDETNTKTGSVNVATGGIHNPGDSANDHSVVELATSAGGFKLFYVEFTPTRGANCVEIRIENAFVADTLVQTTPPDSWTKVAQGTFFNYRWNEGAAGGPDINSFRKNWTEYHGAWAGNGREASYSANQDQTVFIGSVFIKPTRPLWVEKIKVKSEPAQGGFQLMLTSGDPAISPCYNYFVKAPWASGDIISQMISDNQCSSSLNGVLNSKSTGGWFDSSLGNYELQIIRQHTHLYLWDPWAIDMDNHATVYGCQNKMFFPPPAWAPTNAPEGYKNDDGHHAVPNLITGNYIGHACWWEGRLWRLKSSYRNTDASDFVRRPGYTGWDWNTDVFQYMPTVTVALNGGSLKWDDLTNWTAQEFVQDAANETPGGLYFITGAVNAVDEEDARFQADWNTGEVAEGFSHFSQSHGFWYSGHVLDAILRRPFRSTYEIYYPKWFAKNNYGGSDNSTNHLIGDPPYSINTQSFIEFNDSSNNWYNVNGLNLYLPPTTTQESVFYNASDAGWVNSTSGGWMWFSMKNSNARYLSYTSALYIYENSAWKYRFDLSPLYPYTDGWADTAMIASNASSPALMDPDQFKIDTPLISGDDALAIVGHSMEVDFSMCVGALNTYSIISSDKDNIKEPNSFPVFKYAFHRRHMSLTKDNTKTNPSIADHIYGSISPICIESIAEMFSNGGYYSNHGDGHAFQSWYNTANGWQRGGYPAGQTITPGFTYPYFNSSHWIPYNPWKTSSVQITGATNGRKKTLAL